MMLLQLWNKKIFPALKLRENKNKTLLSEVNFIISFAFSFQFIKCHIWCIVIHRNDDVEGLRFLAKVFMF